MKRFIYILTMLLSIGAWLVSCNSIKYVPIETVKINTEYRDRWLRDSIHVHDSIFMFMKGMLNIEINLYMIRLISIGRIVFVYLIPLRSSYLVGSLLKWSLEDGPLVL